MKLSSLVKILVHGNMRSSQKIFNVDVVDLNLHQLAVQNSILVISITSKS